MLEFAFHPQVYSTSSNTSLLKMLEAMWISEHKEGNGNLYIISGYSNFNGGVRFYPTFTSHIKKGGKVFAFLSGSTTKKLSSTQVVEELLHCGVKVFVVNKKNLMHAKCYGVTDSNGQQLIVTSGNFTGTGMSLNGEASIRMDHTSLSEMNFSWNDLITNLTKQNWEMYEMNVNDCKTKSNPGWKLLYNEVRVAEDFDDSKKISMLLLLSASDTIRIQAVPGTIAGYQTRNLGLSNDTFHFFPPLLGKLNHTFSPNYSCNIQMNYINLGLKKDCRVHFDPTDNPSFRISIEPLQFTKIAQENDLALISRTNNTHYELRIFQKGSTYYKSLFPYLENKKYTYLDNNEVIKVLNL